jgi:hypothetical protein
MAQVEASGFALASGLEEKETAVFEVLYPPVAKRKSKDGTPA